MGGQILTQYRGKLLKSRLVWRTRKLEIHIDEYGVFLDLQAAQAFFLDRISTTRESNEELFQTNWQNPRGRSA